MVGRGRDPPGSVTRRREGGSAAYGVGVTLCLPSGMVMSDVVYVYSFMRIRHLGFFLIDLFSDYKTDIHFSFGSRSYGFVAIISGTRQ